MDLVMTWIENHQGTAAWLQAIASVAAIWWTGKLATKQAANQYASALKLQERQRLREEVVLGEAVVEIVLSACKLIFADTILLSERERVCQYATKEKPFDIGALVEAENAIAAIPLHSLPVPHMVRLTMISSATVRQYRAKVENVFESHRTMDANAFTDFFNSMEQMKASIKMTAQDLRTELNGLKEKLN